MIQLFDNKKDMLDFLKILVAVYSEILADLYLANYILSPLKMNFLI